MSVSTTFELFQQSLREAIDRDTVLSVVMKAALKLRVEALPRVVPVVLNAAGASSVSGNVSVDVEEGGLLVALGAPATPNRAEFTAFTFLSAVRVTGSNGDIGALVGHPGDGETARVDYTDISIQYRLAPTDPWRSFSRFTVLPSVTWIQFAIVIEEQVANAIVPQLWLLAEQL